MATFANIGLAEPSTITKAVSAVQVTRNSSAEFQEILTLGDAESSLGLARVLGADAASTEFALAVRPIVNSTGARQPVILSSTGTDNPVSAAQASTVWVTQVSSVGGVVVVSPVSTAAVRATLSSTEGDNKVTIYQSTASDLNVTVDGYVAPSTTVNVSSLAGVVNVRPGSPQANSYLPVRLTDGSSFLAAGNEYTDGSTYSSLTGVGIAYNNSSNNTMRQVSLTQPLPVQVVKASPTLASTTAFITSTHSTAVYALVSSVAASRHKVYAVSVFSTHTRPSTILFMSSLAQTLYALQFGSGSSGVTGAVLSIPPPGFLFGTEAAAALNVIVEDGSSAASTTLVRVNVSYFTEA